MREAEEWRPVVGFEGVYSVSSLGRVRRDLDGPGCGGNAVAGRILKHGRAKGYRCVVLCRFGVRTGKTVHALVAEAFLGSCPDGYEVDHVRGDKDDNRASMLEYVTGPENTRRAMRNGLLPTGDRNGTHTRPERVARGERQWCAKLTSDDVRLIRARRPKSRGDCMELAVVLGVSYGTIRDVAYGQTWRHVSMPAVIE